MIKKIIHKIQCLFSGHNVKLMLAKDHPEVMYDHAFCLRCDKYEDLDFGSTYGGPRSESIFD